MRDRGFLENAVTEIEDVRPSGEGVKHAVDGPDEPLAAGKQGQRIEVALHRKSGGQLFVGPGGVHRLVEANGIHLRLASISGKLPTRALWKANETHMRMTLADSRGDARSGPDDPTLELCWSKAPGPAVEQLDNIRAGFDLA